MEEKETVPNLVQVEFFVVFETVVAKDDFLFGVTSTPSLKEIEVLQQFAGAFKCRAEFFSYNAKKDWPLENYPISLANIKGYNVNQFKAHLREKWKGTEVILIN